MRKLVYQVQVKRSIFWITKFETTYYPNAVLYEASLKDIVEKQA